MSFAALSLRDVLRVPLTRSSLDPATFALYVLPPVLCYLAAAVLAVLPQKRMLQSALWPLTAMLALRAVMSIDMSMELPERKFLNIDLVLSMFTIATRTLEWTLAKEPLTRHIRPSQSTPSVIMDALDLAGNLRGYGWNWSKGLYVPLETRPTSSRSRFVTSAFISAGVHAFICGILHRAVQSFSPDTFGSINGGTIFDATLPPLIRYFRSSIIATLCAFGIYCVLQMGYDLCIISAIVIFGQDPAQWPPAFEAPWFATSVRDFWGRRWHQWFRRTFIFLGSSPLSLMFGRVGGIFGAFLASAVFHHIALLTLNGQMELWRMLLSFGMMATGVVGERVFLVLTGRKVGGLAGWIWTMSWLILWGNAMVDGWARAGMFGCSSFVDSATPVRALVERSVTALDAFLRTF
ncbi:hypothetical protein HYDPIDRAFT_100254 [Hydnomerulius pinastri MD-312]|uniref:Wax synthase domain-containing protein n=1 Tax=Hydnomerulius pinastri MD-312 TaxID=994086 RepID=A0A0C9W1G2_9AGAM|nr:hypothetical protein HYDPIDRAFT_100254 [Hydnomerulius pinastri MD-312]